MNANQIINKLIGIELSSDTAPDEQRVIREARMRLQASVNASVQTIGVQYQSKRVQVSGPDPTRIKAAMDHAVDVASMWGHDLAERV